MPGIARSLLYALYYIVGWLLPRALTTIQLADSCLRRVEEREEAGKSRKKPRP